MLSLAVNEKLLANRKLQSAEVVLLYYSMIGEVETHELVEKLFVAGKTVLLPRVRDGYNMDLVQYKGKSCLKPAGVFHILEPQGKPYTYYNNIDVAVIPGIAFTKDGKRMGRGKGYYDRLLTNFPKLWKIGVCFPFQVLEQLPVERYDVPMDELVF